jgi:hypothetical protein
VFGRFFPPEVVNALLGGVTPVPGTLYPFPETSQIPVLVTARMSMSFPILFCAVPVIYCDSEGTQWKTWISDGGIVSNFPSNLFDQSLPPWPTFGLDLIDVQRRLGDTAPHDQYIVRKLVTEPPYIESSQEANPERLPTGDIRTTQAFLMGAVNAARGWIDNSQKRLPGFGERIVAMNIYQNEGGLNLTMDRPKIERLARRGLLGVDRLLELWDPGTIESQWRYHRWVRMRTLMRELEEVGQQWNTWYAEDPGTIPLDGDSFQHMTRDMPDRAGGERSGFPFPIVNNRDRARAQLLIAAFNGFARQADQATPSPGSVDEAGEIAGASAAEIVFNAPDSPAPNPKLLLMPPFR